ncbi:DUF11 domain-containing protein [Acinetobacter celticus]|uniref:DUF11 domain-containing protein n=1 Tax=Acinetobacter celticus TaxID=1891224 RepID=A0A1C3D0R0_9GAMM|nr:DUF11 domain-containing protein [Acinetobacter celticus]ODA14642.1 hypothetical protein BBP83_02270 [Acinetobacter celticus]
MKHSFQLSKLAASLAVIGGVSLFSSQTMAAVPLAGTNISNVATATYTDNTGTERVVTSNEVKTLVAQIGSFTLEANRSAQTTPNGQVSLSHILTNTGNGTDKFKIELDSAYAGTFSFDMTKVAVYLDRNKDGIADSNVALQSTDLIELASGESVGLVIVATTPSTATKDQLDQIKITATATQTALYSTVSKENDDTVTITTGAVMQITKAASVSVTQAGKEIEYTLTFKNTGNATATNVAIFDVLPASVEFVKDSARYSGSSNGLTDLSTDGDNFEYNDTKKAFLFNIREVKANTTGTLKFKVKVKANTPASDIKNTAYVDPDGKLVDPTDPTGPREPIKIGDLPPNPNTPPIPEDPSNPTTVPSNPSIVTVEGTYSGSVNDALNDGFKDGETSTNGDDLITVAGQQGVPVLFGDAASEPVVVHNRGNATDTYNLTIDKTAFDAYGVLPAGSIVEILKADGRTPVTDTNGDGIVDTGPIEAGKNAQFVVRMTLPTGEVIAASGVGVKLVSTSVKNAEVDTLKLVISALTANSVDLTSKTPEDTTDPVKGEGVGVPTSVVDKTTPPATPAIFDITINNTGNIPDNYVITLPNVPDGWTVEVFEKDSSGNCTTTKVTNSGNIKATESKSFCLVVTPPAGTPADTAHDIKVEIKSPATGTKDDITFNVKVEEQRQLTFTPDRQGQVAPGGTIVYSHVLTNTGNILEGDKTTYPLEIDWSSTLAGVNTSIYVDINNNDITDAGELVTGTTALERNASLAALLAKTNGAGLSQNEAVNILVKVEAPATATAGESDTTIVTFKPTGSNNKPADVLITDRTVINLGQVRLTKSQAVSACGTAPTTYVTTNLTAKPGECVYYKIDAINDGNVNASDVVISDTVPSYTTIYQGSVKPNPGASESGGKVSYTVSTLTPAATATLEFAVKVDQ